MTERPDVLNNHAITLAAKGDFDDAISCLQRAVVLDKDNYLLWYNMGTTFRDAGKLKEARKALETAFRLAPDNMDVVEALAQVSLMQKDYVASARFCQSGIDTNEYNPRLWNLLGVISFQQADFRLASECFERALSLNAFDGDALFNLRDTYRELGENDAAAECERRMKELGVE